MATNLHSSTGFSPRISFSHDLCQSDSVTIERCRSDSLLLESNDFDFCIGRQKGFEQDPSSAEELFYNGKILPLEIKQKQLVLVPPKPPSHPTRAPEKKKKENLKEIMEKSTKTEDRTPLLKSFWRFNRSSSCGNAHKTGLIPLLLRSNSTGSTPAPKRSSASTKGTTTSSSSSFYPYPTSSKKNYGNYNNGGRISPVLNVPPPYISKGTVGFFGLGSLFCNGKEKNKKKRSEFL